MAVHSADLDRLVSGPGLSESAQAGALAVASAAATAVAFAVSPARVESGPVVCPFRLVTGLPCPGCGLTRSWVYLAHGDFGAALHANPFGYVTMAAALVLVAAVVVATVSRRPMPSLARLVRSRPAAVVGVAWLAFAAVRLVVVAIG